MIVTGFLYKKLLNGDIWMTFLRGKDRPPAGTIAENKTSTDGNGTATNPTPGTEVTSNQAEGSLCQVKIETDPPVGGGTFLIEGKTRGEFTSGTFTVNLPCGKVSTVQLDIPNFKAIAERVKAVEKTGQTQRFTLQAEKLGVVLITVDAPAKVYVDGVESGSIEASNPREFTLTVSGKPHKLRFKNELLGLEREEEVTAVENVKSTKYIQIGDEQKNKTKNRK